MSITPLPTPPSRNDPTNFSARGDAFLGALPAFATEANALAVDVNLDAVAAAAAEVAATAAAAAATAAANVTKWVSGTTYAEGVVVWSPITYLSYRRKTAGAGTTDPSADSANWAQAAGTGTGDVTLAGTETLTNKTINIANNTLTGVQPTLVSGTNIKTLNGGSVLGSGNLAIAVGSWTKLSSAVAFSNTTVDFTGFVTSDYNTYAVVVYAFSVQTGSYAAFRFFVGGTIRTSEYTGSGFYSDASGSLLARGGSSGTSAQLVQLTNGTNTNLAGIVYINANNFNSMTGTGIPSVNSQLGGGTFNTNFYQSGSLNTTSPITGIRFYAEGGGTLAGYFDLYGIKR